MTETELGELLLLLAGLFALSYALAGALDRVRIPGILGALFVGMAVHWLPIGTPLSAGRVGDGFSLLAQLGVLFLLFFIGLQVDFAELRRLSRDIVWATVLNTALPFLLGVAVMLALGYGWAIALVIGVTRMPTAEAVIVPILDEFQLIRSRVGEFIVGAGVLDDVIEVFLVALVSVWIGQRGGPPQGLEREVGDVVLAAAVFAAAAVAAYRWVLAPVAAWLPRRPRNLLLLGMLVLLAFGGFSQITGLGLVVGAITAGVLLRPVYNRAGAAGQQATAATRAVSYGFFGLVFFLWVGASVDLAGLVRQPSLALALFLAAFLGKLGGIFVMVPMGRLNAREAWTVGIGLNARLTTEVIVAKLLLDAGIIGVDLFTALVAASSLSTLLVPLAFTVLVRAWGTELRRTAASP